MFALFVSDTKTGEIKTGLVPLVGSETGDELVQPVIAKLEHWQQPISEDGPAEDGPVRVEFPHDLGSAFTLWRQPIRRSWIS